MIHCALKYENSIETTWFSHFCANLKLEFVNNIISKHAFRNDDQAIGAEGTVEACKYYASFDCEKTCGLCDLCTPSSTRAECSTLCKLGREKCTKFCKSGQDRCLTFFANMF